MANDGSDGMVSDSQRRQVLPISCGPVIGLNMVHIAYGTYGYGLHYQTDNMSSGL